MTSHVAQTMISKAFVSTTCLLSILLVLVKPEDRIAEPGHVPVDRCKEVRLTSQYFACKLGDCDQWISFIKCPENTVSTHELNMVQKYMVCKNSLDSKNVAYETEGLVPKSMCSDIFMQGDILWCHYEHCWFAFTGCDENKTQTDYLNFRENAVHCQPKETATTPASTSTPRKSMSTHSVYQQHSGQLSIHWNVMILLCCAFCTFVCLS